MPFVVYSWDVNSNITWATPITAPITANRISTQIANQSAVFGGTEPDLTLQPDDEDIDAAKRLHSEFLGGGGESDSDEQDDTEGDLTVRRQALKKCSLDG